MANIDLVELVRINKALIRQYDAVRKPAAGPPTYVGFAFKQQVVDSPNNWGSLKVSPEPFVWIR
jgi:hypothetical protein